MAQWGKTDHADSVPSFLSADAAQTNKSNDADNAVFVDLTEAAQAANRAKGLKTPGWNLYNTYQTQNGDTRHITEALVPMKVTAALAGDQADDAIVLDRTITIATQPLQSAATVDIAGSAAMTLVVAAAAVPAQAVTFQWQYKVGAAAYVNVALASTAATLEIASTETAEYVAGNLFRCVVSTQGAVDAISDSVTLTQSA
tara:strand:- start:204 stop:803 length:600 start_codon:yes stop_codon:yes gene_type:complete